MLIIRCLIAALFFIGNSANAKTICQDLAVGESEVVTNYSSKTGVRQFYSLYRFSSNVWHAYINIDFNPSRKVDGKRSQVANDIENRVRECFLKGAPLLKDELNRELRLFLYEKKYSHLVKKPREVNISIVPRDKRSNSAAWSQDAGCPTIIHESLHLLGLVDEYKERLIKKNNRIAYDCRHLGQEKSIMRSIEYDTKSYDHILFSGHMNVILYPNCVDRNEVYYQCAKNASLTSSDSSPCPSSPSICYDESWLIN